MEQLLNSIPNVAAIIFVSLFIFVLIREIICWYFKINERLNVNKEILAELKKINRQC